MQKPEFTLGWELEAVKWTGKGRYDKTCGEDHYDEYDNLISCEDYGDCVLSVHPSLPLGIKYQRDGSVDGEGHEFVLSPELKDNYEQALELLKHVCSHTRVDKSCGFHVHVGLANYTSKRAVWAGWMVQLAKQIETAAFEAVPKSRHENDYCRAWSTDKSVIGVVGKSYSSTKYQNKDRYFWMNVVEMFRPGGIRTVENRLLGNTRRYSYCLAWIGFTLLMAKSAFRLTKDPSCLSAEINMLTSILDQIKKVFIEDEGNTYVTAYKIARLADLMPEAEIERPLQSLVYIERDLSAEVEWESELKERIDLVMSYFSIEEIYLSLDRFYAFTGRVSENQLKEYTNTLIESIYKNLNYFGVEDNEPTPTTTAVGGEF